MAARALKDMDATDSEVASRLKTVFDILFAGTMSASAAQGRALGFLKSEDQTTFHPRHRLHQATELVRQMSKHYSPPGSRRILALGQQGLDIIDAHIESRRSDDELTEHDVTVAGELALVLCGGDGSSPKIVDEQAFLDLEREAFLRLCGFQKTRDRIGHMLKTGKPLRN